MPRLRALTLLALTLVACKNPERDELLNWLDDYDYERSGVRVALCTCPAMVDLGYVTDDECEADQPALSSADKECIADVFEGTEALGIDYYSCVTPLLREYGLCLGNQLLSECPLDWDEPCTSDYEAAVASCPTLSSAKTAAVLDCSG